MTFVITQAVPILVGAVIFTVIGGIWYMPQVFGRVWMQLQFGSTELPPDRKKKAAKAMAASFVLALITCAVLRKLLLIFGVATPSEGVQYSLWLAIGFIIVPQYNDILFSGKPVKLYAITTGYYVVSLVLVGALYGWWQ
ncbi:MAG: DUF1761 domain-containing protein [Candidatus Komeilibacteria bacterium]|nr:DUF1761 domain-containing protein [Candidatus Komeilibacteria bacterium]